MQAFDHYASKMLWSNVLAQIMLRKATSYYVPQIQHLFSLTLLDLQNLRGTRKTIDVHKLYKAI